MLKKYKNGFIEVIEKVGLDPAQFDTKEEVAKEGPVFILHLRTTPLRFVVRSNLDDIHAFNFRYTRLSLDFPESDYMPSDRLYISIDYVYDKFSKWLSDIRDYFDDLLLPDLWEQISVKNLANDSLFNEEDTSEFSEEEKIQLRLALSEFRLLVVQNFNPNPEQMRVVEDRLSYVSAALDRLNRFDWKSVLISAVLSISIALTLDTARGKALFELLKRVFSTVVYLLQ